MKLKKKYSVGKTIEKIKIIVLSRLKKEKPDPIVEAKRKICAFCEWNTKNQIKLSLGVRLVKGLSDFYSWITGNAEKDNLGNCTACEICSIYYKTLEISEVCEKGKWKSIYIPNNK